MWGGFPQKKNAIEIKWTISSLACQNYFVAMNLNSIKSPQRKMVRFTELAVFSELRTFFRENDTEARKVVTAFRHGE